MTENEFRELSKEELIKRALAFYKSRRDRLWRKGFGKLRDILSCSKKRFNHKKQEWEVITLQEHKENLEEFWKEVGEALERGSNV